jgi:hypothetical protein
MSSSFNDPLPDSAEYGRSLVGIVDAPLRPNDGVFTSILADNTGLISLNTLVTLTSPTPTTLGSVFTKTFTTALGVFTETLTVTLVTPGPSSLGIEATGTVVQTTVLSGEPLDLAPVMYSAAYTQNGGPGAQINASFNNATVPARTPEPASLLLVGGGLAGLVAVRRRPRNA